MDDAKNWAFGIIESEDQPPAGVIDVAMCGTLNELREKLSEVGGERDNQQAARMLLGALRATVDIAEAAMYRAVRQAMQIVRHANLGDDEYYPFNRIEDEIWLATNGRYGTLEQCHADLIHELSRYQEVFTGGNQ